MAETELFRFAVQRSGHRIVKYGQYQFTDNNNNCRYNNDHRFDVQVTVHRVKFLLKETN